MAYNEELCKERHKAIDEKLGVHNTRLNNHVGRLDTLEQDGREIKTQINNLIKSIDSLVSTMKWLIGLSVPTILTIIGLLLRK
jgi:chromosome segregation ATPase